MKRLQELTSIAESAKFKAGDKIMVPASSHDAEGEDGVILKMGKEKALVKFNKYEDEVDIRHLRRRPMKEALVEKVHTIKNDAVKPRGAPKDKARAFDKVNPKTGTRPNRSLLKRMQKDADDFFAVESEKTKEYTMCLVMSVKNSDHDDHDYYGVNVLFYPGGKIEASTADQWADKEWRTHRGRIIEVARAFLKIGGPKIEGPGAKFMESEEEKKPPSSVEMHKRTLFIERLAEYFDLDEETFKPLSTKDLRVMYNKLLMAGLIKRINLDG